LRLAGLPRSLLRRAVGQKVPFDELALEVTPLGDTADELVEANERE
jgi:hypothetical protein